MKAVFVQPRVGYEGASYWEALGVGYIISYAEKYIPDLEVDFYSGAFDSDETIVNGCSDADFVGFSCTSPQLKHALQLAGQIKELNPECKVVIGGWHATAQPEETAKIPVVDYVVAGEGEEGMLRILKGEARQPIVYSKPVENLNTLPWPDRDAIKVERYIQVAYRENGERITSVEASRGCFARCIFCSEYLKTKGFIRRRIPSCVVDEIEFVVNKYNIDFIKFVDAEINTSLSWLKDLCKELIKRRVDVELGANFHAAVADRELFKLMKEAGFREIWVGVESGSPRILKSIKKGVTVDQIKKVFKWAKEAGLKRRAYFMVGFPDETLEDINLTFKLAEEIDADVYGMTILCPYPGTELYSPTLYADVDWSTADEYGNNFYRTSAFTNEELKAIQQKFMQVFKGKLCYRLRCLS